MSLVQVTGASVVFGGVPLFENVGIQVEQGDRWGIIGRNGSGKTTLLKLILGERVPDAGSVVRSSSLRIAVMDQYRDLGDAETVWQAAARGFADLFALEQSLAAQANAMGEAGENVTQAQLDRYSRDLERFEMQGGYTATARVDTVLSGLGFDPDEARTRPVGALSGGERGRLALAGQLAAPADLLILDEPTNHLDIDTARWLEGYLKDINEAVLVISHDRAFLAAVVDHVLHFEGGSAESYEADYAGFIRQRAERRLARERAVRKQDAKIAAEEDFIRRNIAGQKSSQAKGRRRRLERLPRLSPPPGSDGTMAVAFTAASRGGDQVIVTEKVAMKLDDRVLLEPWSGILRRGDIVGLVGPNGAGKSTLLHTLLGERPADGGEVRVMPSVEVAYYRQDLGDVNPNETLFDLIAHRRPMWTRGQVQGHLGRFDFSGDSVQRRAGTLSGGERARVALALMMLEQANLLVFDEPTNHLDVESIEALEDALESYEGTVLLVSHDRALLETLCTRIWAFEGTRLVDFPGGFGEWEEDRERRTVNREPRTVRATHASPSGGAREKGPARGQVVASQRESTARSDSREAKKRAEAAAVLEVEIAALEERVADIEARLADSSLYLTPEGPTTALELSIELTAAREELDTAMARWGELA